MKRPERNVRLARPAAAAILMMLASAPIWAQGPLDILNPAAREVFVQLENSADLSAVGQSFGPLLPASYSAAGNIGTLVIPVTSHEQMLAGTFQPVPGSFTPILIEFDLTTFEAASQSASGAMGSGQIGTAFTQGVLDTLDVAGYMGPTAPPLFCASQAEVDGVCMIVPSFCGQVCTLVPGVPYDAATGLVNLVGIESQQGCDGAICFGPFSYFAGRGDLLLTEAPPAPPASGGGDGKPCFIATAAYGTPLAGDLDRLRAFRDERMLGNPLGAALADAYYRLSPPIAERIARDGALRSLVRGVLAPMVSMLPAVPDEE